MWESLRKELLTAGIDVRRGHEQMIRALALIEAMLPHRACPLCDGDKKGCVCGGKGWYAKSETQQAGIADLRKHRPTGMKGVPASRILKYAKKLYGRRRDAVPDLLEGR